MMERIPVHLPDYCVNLIEEVVSLSDYSFAIGQLTSAPFGCELKYATPSRDTHMLLYQQDYHEHLSHFVVNAAYKIRRMWSAPPKARLMPTTRQDIHLPLEEEYELARNLGQSPRAKPLRNLSKLLSLELLRQVTSLPVDLRVEREIAGSLPEHSPLQRAYLRQKVLRLADSLEEGPSEYVTRFVHRCDTTMNSAFIQGACDLADVTLGRAVRKHPSYDLAQKLLEPVTSTPLDTGVEGDRKITDAWARELELRGWYRWTRMDSL